MNILVTGGAGFIGSHLILKLLEEGHEVVCVDNMNAYYDPALKEARLNLFRDRITFYQVDIADAEALEGVFKAHSFDKICHLAAQAGVRYSLENPFVYGTSNFVGSINVFEFAKRYRVPHVVFASSSSVYGKSVNTPFREDDPAVSPVAVYGASKRAGELLASAYVHLFGLNITCLRFFSVYGPYGRPDMALFKFTKAILAGESIDVYNSGEMKRDFTYVDDIVAGFIAALKKPMGFAIFNLGHGKSVWLLDFIKVIEKKLGKKAKMNMLPMQPGDVPETFADTTKAKELLGFEAKVPVEEGVGKFVDWYRGYYGV